MSATPEQKKKLLIDKVVTRARDKLNHRQVQQADAFIRQYYQRVAPQDLIGRSVLDLYGAALALWNLAHRRRRGEHIIHVYNPGMEEHGWQSTHTIIEVIQEDMPFLVDSVRMLLNHHGLTVHLIVHPVVHTIRDERGVLSELLPEGTTADGAQREAMMHFEVDRQTDPATLTALEEELHEVLEDVRAAVEDWPNMRERLEEIIAELDNHPPALEASEVEESKAFLNWLDRDHFAFLGYREYRLTREADEDMLCSVPDSGLGILRTGKREVPSSSFSQLPPEARRIAREPKLLILTKSSSKATVHRPVYMDHVGIKRFDEEGNVTGEYRFLGLYTSAAYNRVPQEIPVLRRKVQHVLECSGLRRHSHSGKALLNILETLPRGELFQSTDDELCRTAMGILHLQERQSIRLFVRRDPFQRFITCIVYLPREGYDTNVRMRIQSILRETFNARSVDFTVFLSESVLARLYLVAHTEPGTLPQYDEPELEARVAEAIRSWDDNLRDSLLWELGEEQGNRLYARYRSAFPGSYRDDYPAAMAVHDILKIESLSTEEPLGMALYRPLEAPEGALRLKLFSRSDPISLSVVLPMLENMGVKVVDQRPHRIRPGDDLPVWLQDIGMVYEERGQLDTEQIRQIFQDAFARVWSGKVENDGFNRLVLAAQLPWREVAILRTYCKYLLQTGFPFSQAYMEQALAKHPQIASLLVNLFTARFDPAQQDQAEQRVESLAHSIRESLDAVPNLDEDRIQRRFFILIQATLRTNYFQRSSEGEPKDYIAIKLDPTEIPDLPPPRPRYEVFVYSPRTEGVHLRGGKVARGGIRWSDRLEDFRTEVFGLMKAQMVKNAVIVPVGAKGGFVVKRPPAGDRDALMQEVVACYSTFISALLDISDNLDGDRVLPPPNVVRYDDDDPYLVVAADKGTATFSDTANAIAKEYGFWLGDAFASGGSTGYDHKKMGITARGAWESVRRHFREMGTNIQEEDFTVVGIGSMSGDVFGNGMLLSRHIKLVGAFSHSHIFLDPNPDTEASYQERKRLFDLRRSSWADYDPDILSAGGGIYPRTAKSIPLSPEVRAVLGVEAETMHPNELIIALLKAPVDLLWNGGIGTFIKASFESHEAAGDRANDAIRVDATQLRCKVIGEGGNLGLTQNARIEYARSGGHVNTDFIDNSGGVDCSDHEVNIKILLDKVVKDGDLSEKQRNQLLVDMTEEVAALVLRNNYQQTAALTLSEQLAPELLEEHVGYIRTLEKAGHLERATWQLPEEEEIAARRAAGQGFTRPELAVLLAYSKIVLFDELLASEVCDDAYLADELITYFPAPMQARFADRMRYHRLRPEIVATFIANSIVNRMGITFAYRVQEHTGATMPDIARAYTVSRKVFALPDLWKAVEDLDNEIDSGHQVRMLREIRDLANRATLWFLRNRKQPLDISAAIEAFGPGVDELTAALPELLDPLDGAHLQERAQVHIDNGVPEETAWRFAGLPLLPSALDITDVAARLERHAEPVGRLYFALGAELDLTWLRDQIAELPTDDHWSRLARGALRDDLFRLQRTLARDAVLLATDDLGPDEQLAFWLETNQTAVDRYQQRLTEFKAGGTADLALLSVALDEVRKLLRITETASD